MLAEAAPAAVAAATAAAIGAVVNVGAARDGAAKDSRYAGDGMKVAKVRNPATHSNSKLKKIQHKRKC